MDKEFTRVHPPGVIPIVVKKEMMDTISGLPFRREQVTRAGNQTVSPIVAVLILGTAGSPMMDTTGLSQLVVNRADRWAFPDRLLFQPA